MKKISKIFQSILFLCIMFFPLASAYAQFAAIPCPTGINCQTGSANSLISVAINWLLSIAFGLAVLFLIIGGFRYIISGGNQEAAEKARGTIINAIIGIVIIIMSYVIVTSVAGLVSNPGGTQAP